MPDKDPKWPLNLGSNSDNRIPPPLFYAIVIRDNDIFGLFGYARGANLTTEL